MKVVNIYVCGSYEYKSRIGTWIYYMEYNGAVKKQSGQAGGIKSPAQTLLLALYKAIQCINQPCKLIVHSKQGLGFNKPKQSPNKELILKIIQDIKDKGLVVEFETNCDFTQVDKWEELYGSKKASNKKINPNDIFAMTNKQEEKQLEKMAEEANQDWRAMYSDLMGPSQGCWVPGSGGY